MKELILDTGEGNPIMEASAFTVTPLSLHHPYGGYYRLSKTPFEMFWDTL